MAMTLPYRRQQVTPRPGGRVAGDRRADVEGEYGSDRLTAGNTALAPKPGRGPAESRPTQPRLRVAPPVPVSGPKAPFVATMLAAVIVGVVGILVLNTKINENAFRLDALQEQQAKLDRAEAELTKSLAEKESPTSLAAAAQRLGMVPATKPAFITLPNGAVLGVPRPASGQPSASGTQAPRANQQGGTVAGQPRR